MAKWPFALVIFGVLLIAAMFTFTRVVITPEMRLAIVAAENLLNSPLGQALAGLGPELAGTAQGITAVSRVLAIEGYVYIAGAFFVALGLILGRGGRGPKKWKKKERK